MVVFFVFIIVLVVSDVVIAVLTYLRNRANPSNALFAGMLIALALWILGTAFENGSNAVIAYVGLLLDFGMAPLIFLFFLLFSLVFPKGKEIQKKWLLTTPAIIVCLLAITPLTIADVRFTMDGLGVIPGPFYFFYGLSLAFYALPGIWNLIKRYRLSTGLLRLQILYVLLGIGISSVIAFITILVIPRISQSPLAVTLIPQVGVAGVMIFVVFTSIAILRHRLLDVRFIVTRSIVYFFLIAFIAGSFAGATFLSGLLFSEALGLGQFITSGLVALLVVLLLDPIKNYVSRATDKIFFKAKIDYNTVLQKLSTSMAELIEIDPLLEDVARITEQELKVENVITIPKNKQGNFRARVNRPPHDTNLLLKGDSGLIKYLAKGEISVLDSLERKIEDTTSDRERKRLEASRDDMHRAHAAVAAPIMRKGELTGVFFVGPKLSGDSFSEDELRLFKVLGPQLATALEKAKLFDEVKGFAATLQRRVEDATHELRDRNAYLVALQNITSTITRTFDFDKVTQDITNAISNELGFLGGILVFRSNDGRHVYPKAITQTPLISKAMRLLPKPFTSFVGDLQKEKTLDHRVILTGKRATTENLSDVFSPPVPKLIASGMQKMLGIKTIVAVPVVSEDEVVGAFDFAVAKPVKDISDREYEIMGALADQTGIAYRNWRYVERIREANRELEDANERLMQLDQAKTEFVSIASHQLRTPMTGIAGYLSMLVGGDFGKMTDDHAKILKQLLDESQRMIRLINLFLNVSKIEAGKFELTFVPTQMEDLITGEISELKKIAQKKNLTLDFTPPKKKIPQVIADGDKLKDVVLNLVDNAIKYTEKGGIKVSMEQQDGMVRVNVQDTGIGIEPDEAKHLFQKFVRASGIAQIHPDGSGLGLFIAKKIVEAHGGSIWVESAGQGKGSTFHFTIPLTQKSTGPRTV